MEYHLEVVEAHQEAHQEVDLEVEVPQVEVHQEEAIHGDQEAVHLVEEYHLAMVDQAVLEAQVALEVLEVLEVLGDQEDQEYLEVAKEEAHQEEAHQVEAHQEEAHQEVLEAKQVNKMTLADHLD